MARGLFQSFDDTWILGGVLMGLFVGKDVVITKGV